MPLPQSLLQRNEFGWSSGNGIYRILEILIEHEGPIRHNKYYCVRCCCTNVIQNNAEAAGAAAAVLLGCVSCGDPAPTLRYKINCNPVIAEPTDRQTVLSPRFAPVSPVVVQRLFLGHIYGYYNVLVAGRGGGHVRDSDNKSSPRQSFSFHDYLSVL